MTDYTELKRLAEAAIVALDKYNADECNFELAEAFGAADDAFHDATGPATVQALIAENERLAKTADCWDRLNVQNKALSDSFQAERDQLKAEVDSLTREADRQYTTIEAYRKDAERFQWLLKNASVILDKKTAYQAETGFIKCDTMPGRTEIESALDAAMGKGEQS